MAASCTATAAAAAARFCVAVACVQAIAARKHGRPVTCCLLPPWACRAKAWPGSQARPFLHVCLQPSASCIYFTRVAAHTGWADLLPGRGFVLQPQQVSSPAFLLQQQCCGQGSAGVSAGSVGHWVSSGHPHSFSSPLAPRLGLTALDYMAAIGTQALAQPWVGYKHLSVPRVC